MTAQHQETSPRRQERRTTKVYPNIKFKYPLSLANEARD